MRMLNFFCSALVIVGCIKLCHADFQKKVVKSLGVYTEAESLHVLRDPGVIERVDLALVPEHSTSSSNPPRLWWCVG